MPLWGCFHLVLWLLITTQQFSAGLFSSCLNMRRHFRSHFLCVNKHVSYIIFRLSIWNVFYIQRHSVPHFLYRVTTQLVCIYQIRYCRLSGGSTERKRGDVNLVGGPSRLILATSAISLPVECVHKWSRPPLNVVLVFTILTYCHIVCIHLSPMTACHWISIPCFVLHVNKLWHHFH